MRETARNLSGDRKERRERESGGSKIREDKKEKLGKPNECEYDRCWRYREEERGNKDEKLEKADNLKEKKREKRTKKG